MNCTELKWKQIYVFLQIHKTLDKNSDIPLKLTIVESSNSAPREGV